MVPKLGCREMLWITRVSRRVPDSDLFNEDPIRQLYLVMKEAAEMIHSPVGLLDYANQIVFVYDVNAMTLDPAGISTYSINLLT